MRPIIAAFFINEPLPHSTYKKHQGSINYLFIRADKYMTCGISTTKLRYLKFSVNSRLVTFKPLSSKPYGHLLQLLSHMDHQVLG